MSARTDALGRLADRDDIVLRSAERQHGPEGWVIHFGCPVTESYPADHAVEMGYVTPGPTPQPGVGEALEGVLLTAAMRTIAPGSAHDGFAAVAEDGLRSFLQDAYPEYLNVAVTTDGQPYSAEAFRRKGSPFPETARVHLREPGGCALVGLMLALATLWLAVSVLTP